jgi:acetyltransferase-like isoleucine patch superfamily enzyme
LIQENLLIRYERMKQTKSIFLVEKGFLQMLKLNSRMPRIFYKLNGTKYGKGLRLIGWPFIFRYSQASITIGQRVTINSGFFSNLIGLYQRTIIVARGKGEIQIGNGVGISGATIYARDKIVIGENSLVGANTKIFDNDFHPLDIQARNQNDFSKLLVKPVIIGSNVFIGCNCIIVKGTKIGDNCIVGAGSVVHGTFPSNCTLAGNPATIISSR